MEPKERLLKYADLLRWRLWGVPRPEEEDILFGLVIAAGEMEKVKVEHYYYDEWDEEKDIIIYKKENNKIIKEVKKQNNPDSKEVIGTVEKFKKVYETLKLSIGAEKLKEILEEIKNIREINGIKQEQYAVARIAQYAYNFDIKFGVNSEIVEMYSKLNKKFREFQLIGVELLDNPEELRDYFSKLLKLKTDWKFSPDFKKKEINERVEIGEGFVLTSCDLEKNGARLKFRISQKLIDKENGGEILEDNFIDEAVSIFVSFEEPNKLEENEMIKEFSFGVIDKSFPYSNNCFNILYGVKILLEKYGIEKTTFFKCAYDDCYYSYSNYQILLPAKFLKDPEVKKHLYTEDPRFRVCAFVEIGNKSKKSKYFLRKEDIYPIRDVGARGVLTIKTQNSEVLS